MIALLYNISSIISSLLILYIVDKETGKYFLNQVWLSLDLTKNEIESYWTWSKLSVLGLLVTLKRLFFNGLIAVTGHLYFICAKFCVIFLFAIHFWICVLYKCFFVVSVRYIYIYIYIKWSDEIQIDHQLKSAQWVYQSFE